MWICASRFSLHRATQYGFVVIRLQSVPSRFTPRHAALPGIPGQRNRNYHVAVCVCVCVCGPYALIQEFALCSTPYSLDLCRKSFRTSIP